MSLWTLFNDQGKLSLDGYTEDEVRSILKQDESGTVYAENESGDFIETYNGPTMVGMPGKWYVVHPNGETVATRVTEESARKLLEKRPDLYARCPATNETINKFNGPRTVEAVES